MQQSVFPMKLRQACLSGTLAVMNCLSRFAERIVAVLQEKIDLENDDAVYIDDNAGN